MPSREEINLQRLLGVCETMARNLKEEDERDENWRFKSYVGALCEMLNNLKNKSQKPPTQDIREYTQRIDFLKGLMAVHEAQSPLDKVKVMQVTPKGIHTKETHEIYQAMDKEVDSQVRGELFSKPVDNHLRQRRSLLGTVDNIMSEEKEVADLDELLRHHHNVQEKIAENMLSLAKNIKEQSLMAGKILKNDSQKVEKSLDLANKNISDIRIHSDKLQEHTRSTWQCWSWVMLILVVVVFINTVIMMKMLKKKS